jgi:isopenicillin-N epimerase
MIDPTVVFLNHGSFGACPRSVFDEYQRWQRELEGQPVEFLGRRANGLLDAARARLADYLHVAVDDLVFVPNATSGVNVVARSWPLEEGDEVLTTDHEYGALDRTWQHVCAKAGARYVRQPVALPVTTPEAMVEAVWRGVTSRTRVLFLSHVTSPTALTFPVAELCRRARDAGIVSVVDGAHAPGQIPLDLTTLGADVYSGNCHKWLGAPKGSAFLYVRPAHQAWVESLIVSWGWVEGSDQFRPESTFVSRNQWQGTRDVAAFLAVPAAIDFQDAHGWDAVRAACHSRLAGLSDRIGELTGLPPIAPPPRSNGWPWYGQMAAIPLPAIDAPKLKRRLYDEDRIEVPIVTWNNRNFVRVSVQGYNTEGDLEALAVALARLLPAVALAGEEVPSLT